MDRPANLIVDLTLEFSLEVIKYTEVLDKNKCYNLSNQLFRSGTSIGANVNEAQGCESKAVLFIKLKFLPMKQRRQNIGFFCVSEPTHILILMDF